MNTYKTCFPYTLLLTFIFAFQFSGCATNTVKVNPEEEIEIETTQLQESKLLDVGILLFE